MIKIKRLVTLSIILLFLMGNKSYGAAYKLSQDAEKIPVLLYHHIASEEEIKKQAWEKNGSVISLEKFNEQINFLKENDYYIASLEELDLFIDGKKKLPKKTLVITFDDGYLSNVEYAYPLMKKYGFRASVFMVGATATRDESNLRPGELLHIPAKKIHDYEDIFEFGSHSFNLHSRDEKGRPLLLVKSKKEIIKDLKINKVLFKSKYFAYPYGAYNEDTIEYIRELDYTMAFTVKEDFVSRDTCKFEIPRISIDPRASIKEFKEKITP